MGQIITLLIIELICIVIVYVLTNGNLLSPAFVSYVLFTFATVCMLYNYDFWDVTYSWKTVAFVTLGFAGMLIPELYYGIIYKQYLPQRRRQVQGFNLIKVNITVNIFIQLLCLVLLLIQIWRVFSVGKFSLYGLYAIGLVKHSEESFDWIVKISARIIQIFGMIYMYISLHNIIRCKQGVKSFFTYLIPILAYFVSMFFYGNRLGFVKILAAFFVFYVVMRNDMSPRGKVELRKVLKPMLIMATIVIVAFFSLRGFSKVNSTSASRNFIDYMTYYIGSPLYLFDKYVSKSGLVHGRNEVFGQMSLTSLYTTFGMEIDNANNVTYLGGSSYFAGNEYSWFQRPMADFGVLGMFVFTIVIYWIFDYILYRKLFRTKNAYKRNTYVMIYAFFFYIPAMAFYYCQVCNAFSLFTIILIILMVWGINRISRLRIGKTDSR